MATFAQGADVPAQPVAPAAAASSPLADPGPWAVAAFATTSFILGLYNTHLLGSGSLPIVFPFAFFYGGLIQIIVGILEVQRGNLFGAVVFGTYGPFWVIYGAISIWFAKLATPASVSSGVSAFLAMFAIMTFFFFLASLQNRQGARSDIRADLHRTRVPGDQRRERRRLLAEGRRLGDARVRGARVVSRGRGHDQLHLQAAGVVGRQDQQVTLSAEL